MTTEASRNWSILRLLWKYFRKVSGRLGLALLCVAAGAALDLLKAWPLKIIIDHVLLSHPLPPSLSILQPLLAIGSTSQILLLAAGSIVAISALGALISYAEVFVTTSLGYEVVYSLRREIFSHLQKLSLSFHNRAQSGDILYRIGSETGAIKDLLTDSVLKLTEYALTVVLSCWVIFALDWHLGVIAVVVMPLLGLSLAQVYRKTKRTAKLQKRKESLIAGRINEVLRAIPLVQAFSREKYEEDRYDAATEETKRAGIRIARLEAAASRTTQIVVAIGIAATVLYGAHKVLTGVLLPGTLILIVGYVKDMWKPFRRIAKTAGDLSKGFASVERIAEILDIEPEIQDPPDAIEAGVLQGAIEFRDVSFDYGEGKAALRDVSFSVRQGQKLALVGVSGAGKSTIVSLMLRLYDPQQGAVLVDGIDIRRYRRESFRRQIGLVLQDSVLFGATVAENIAYGRPEASREEIVGAARAANADEFIREMENGYDTVVGERGATLSGGQRQRIAIARALIRNPSMLILDEPMTGLDAETEHAVRQALEHLMQGRTCIQITHDLPSVVSSDLVVLLEEGRVLDRGTHEALVARSSRYRELYDMDTNAQVEARAPADAAARTDVVAGVEVTSRTDAVAGADARTPADEPLRADAHTPTDTRAQVAADSAEKASHPTPASSAARRRLPSSARSTGFPMDPELPQLRVAADPERMLKIFRACLEPIDGRSYDVRACEPVRFRCRQSTDRCVLQYRLQVVDRDTGRERFPWVTGILYVRPGEAERLWRELRDGEPWREIPKDWRMFRPVGYEPDLGMLLQVFPYDRKLKTLCPVMDQALSLLGPRLRPAGRHVQSESIEPTRYRTEIGAALEYRALDGQDDTSGTVVGRRYLKVYRNGCGEDTYRLLRTMATSARERRQPYAFVRPIGYLPEWRTLVLEEAPGRSLQGLLQEGQDPAAAGAMVARAIAAFNTAGLTGLRRHSLASQRANVERAGALVRWAVPELADDVRAITEAVSELDDVPTAPIHRDLKPEHVFLTDDRVTFIDLDSVAEGDPVRDVAHLFAHLVCRSGMDSVPAPAARAAAIAFVDEYFLRVPKAWRAAFPVHSAGAMLEVAGSIFKRQEPRWRRKVHSAIKHAHAALYGGVR
ncbi:MAG TPA: ABC transporter transmembrane domain-containing protein [Candidatus Cryosericum sp.]|nr:ABC transporter transmembrane domain-containing protein [Candidatus Cryosericum sp.]